MVIRHLPAVAGLMAYASAFVPAIFAARRGARPTPIPPQRARARDSAVGQGGRCSKPAARLHWTRGDDRRVTATWQAYPDD